MDLDLLATAVWECVPATPGAPDPFTAPAGRTGPVLSATVPGTAAQAWRDAGHDPATREFDADDWWFRTRFAAPTTAVGQAPLRLELAGLATMAEVRLNGRAVAAGTNMFLPVSIEVTELEPTNELVLRFSALDEIPTPVDHGRRGRWRGCDGPSCAGSGRH